MRLTVINECLSEAQARVSSIGVAAKINRLLWAIRHYSIAGKQGQAGNRTKLIGS
jgi:hypothetical protein